MFVHPLFMKKNRDKNPPDEQCNSLFPIPTPPCFDAVFYDGKRQMLKFQVMVNEMEACRSKR
jgi:hypothetical protein